MTKHELAINAATAAFDDVGPIAGVSIEAMEAAIAAYQRVMREPGEGEVRVRVAVLVAEERRWSAAGGHDMSDEWARAKVNLSGSMSQIHYIEATIPAWCPPAEETVEGEVVA